MRDAAGSFESTNVDNFDFKCSGGPENIIFRCFDKFFFEGLGKSQFILTKITYLFVSQNEKDKTHNARSFFLPLFKYCFGV